MRTVKLKRETLIAALVKFFFYCCRNIISYIILSKKRLGILNPQGQILAPSTFTVK